METEMLLFFRDENRTYEKATKLKIIGELEKVFSEFKSKYDTVLIQIPGFNEIDQFVNQDCNRFTFIGNNSASYIIVVFEENEITISDIHEPWNSVGDKLSAEFFQRFYLSKYSDKHTENESPLDFLLKAEKCNNALNEICRDQINYLQKEDYVNWLDKHEYLKDEHYSFSFYPFPKLENFNNLFFKLNQFKYYVELTEDCIKANNEFNEIDISEEEELIKWLIKFESLGNKMNCISETSLNNDENEEEFETGFVTAHEDFKIKIPISDFKSVLEFAGNFFNPYLRIYAKYIEANELEVNKNLNEDIEVFLDLKSLYELVKRIEMPIDCNEKN
jgi:hypothetical protein